MGMSAEDELKVFQNILAQSQEGLNDPNLIGKFAKAKFQLHSMDSMNQMQAQMTTPQVAGGTNSPQPTQSTPMEDLGATGLENQQSPANNGQGEITVPPQV